MTRQDLLKYGIFLDQESGGLLGNAFLQAATDKYLNNNPELNTTGKLSVEALADIRNKLSPMANLIAMLKTSEYVYHHESAVHKLIEAEIETVEQNISYLSGEIK